MDEMTIELCQDAGAPGKRVLKLAGSVTIGEAAHLRDALWQALEGSQVLELDLSALTGIDLTGLQLLCATIRSARALDKQFNIHDGGNEVYLDTLARAGFQQHAGALLDGSGFDMTSGGGY
jgi:ABC-type transporter Mla MlaB component